MSLTTAYWGGAGRPCQHIQEALGGAVSKKEEEKDLLGAFFYRIYEFLSTFSDPPPVVHRPHVPARYAIKFVPASGL